VVVGRLIDQLGGHVERGALDGGADVSVETEVARETKVAEFGASVGVN
jgi:hypothetical protein